MLPGEQTSAAKSQTKLTDANPMGLINTTGKSSVSNQFTTVTNQQQAIQGSGNFAVSGGVNNTGTITFQSLDPLALAGMENVAKSAVQASAKYVEFASETVSRGLEANASLAGKAINTGMTPEQILASKGETATSSAVGSGGKVLAGLAILAIGYFVAKKFL